MVEGAAIARAEIAGASWRQTTIAPCGLTCMAKHENAVAKEAKSRGFDEVAERKASTRCVTRAPR
jgi:hypothetical protein